MLLEGRSAKIFASFPNSSALLNRSPRFCQGMFDTFSLPKSISCTVLSRVDLPALGAPTNTKDFCALFTGISRYPKISCTNEISSMPSILSRYFRNCGHCASGA